jgi:hypothetical protein
MKKLLLTSAAVLALTVPALAQETMVAGPGVTCGPSTAAATTGTTTDTTASTTGTTTETTGTTTTDTTASTTAAPSSTMALSADNQVTAETARTALTGFSTNLEKFASVGTPTVVCLVDLDTLAQADATLKEEITKAQPNTAQIKSKLEANTALMDIIKQQHPTFDINKVRAFDIGPKGELVLYTSA